MTARSVGWQAKGAAERCARAGPPIVRTARIGPEFSAGQPSFIIRSMNVPVRDVAKIRLDNAMLLFDEFVQATIKNADAATLRGLEGRFAERLQIQPSYWSQIKGRSRQIGERLARQFELLCRKPHGWMDEPHAPPSAGMHAPVREAFAPASVDEPNHNIPQDDDERFIVGLVLTYYRRHPQRARARLLDLLGEVLQPSAPGSPGMKGGAVAAKPAGAPGPGDDGHDLWMRTQAAVAPLKGKRGRR